MSQEKEQRRKYEKNLNWKSFASSRIKIAEVDMLYEKLFAIGDRKGT